MRPKFQEHWNSRIRQVGRNASKFSQSTMETLMREAGCMYTYQQDPHNTDAFREGWDRTFGNKEDGDAQPHN